MLLITSFYWSSKNLLWPVTCLNFLLKLDIRYVTWLLTWFAGILCRFCCVGPLPFHVKYGLKPHVYAPSSCRSISTTAVLWTSCWWNFCGFPGVKAKAYYSIFTDIWYCEKNSTWSFCKHTNCFFLFPHVVLCSLSSSIIRIITSLAWGWRCSWFWIFQIGKVKSWTQFSSVDIAEADVPAREWSFWFQENRSFSVVANNW